MEKFSMPNQRMPHLLTNGVKGKLRFVAIRKFIEISEKCSIS